MSNMVVNLLSCLLTIVVALLLKMRKMRNAIGNNSIVRKKEDKWASRASFYVLIVSAIFGVIPGGINGCAQKIESELIHQSIGILHSVMRINQRTISCIHFWYGSYSHSTSNLCDAQTRQ
uniref:G_PROTEIN_RECEP_F1_2 domain-containing protein n=1 Tax=Loa loa TaxID=7209 RepID=A0A1I7VD69_LOALO